MKHLYVFVRRDLDSPQQAVQACHAAMEASRFFLSTVDEHPNLVLCGVKREADLKKIALMLSSNAIRYRVFCDDDLNDEMTALATEPVDGERRLLFKKYQLLK